MDSAKEQLATFLRQYAEGEPVIIFDQPLSDKPLIDYDTDKLQKLNELQDVAHKCTACKLSKTRNKVVFGDGNPDARLMFIGEGPGADEDQQGKPFVGRAGKLLDKIIVAMELDREDVYIANIVKCRPPENRNPEPDESDACLHFLKEQIAIVQPEVIVGLGKVAALYLLGVPEKTAVKTLREQRLFYEGIPFVVTYHPSALLRNQTYKKPTWEDMQMVMKMLAGKLKWGDGTL